MQYNAQTMLIRSQDTGGSGVFAEVKAEQAGWDYLNMAAIRLMRGEKFADKTNENEHVSVILGGKCNIRTSHGEYLNIGRRPDVFSGMPYAVYLPRHSDFEIEAVSDSVEI